MLENIAASLPSDKIARAELSIGQATIGEYTVSRHSQTIEAKNGEVLRLFMNKYDYYTNSDYLGVDITSTSGVPLDGMLKNIAIAFLDGENDATQGLPSLSVVGGDDEVNYVVIDGIKYYKPTIAGTNARYSFWDINPTKETNLKIKTILLIDGESGQEPFKMADEEVNYFVNFKINEHKEQDVSWNSTSDINILLDYDKDGQVVPQTIDLMPLINVPSVNIHQDVIFFVCFGTANKTDYIETANSVLGESGYDFTRTGTYSTNDGSFTFFAVEGGSITLYNTGEFTLYFATVVTENGQYQYTMDGLYQTAVMSSNHIRVICEKSLNDQSVTSVEIDTSNFEMEGSAETSIPQGSDKTFSISYLIAKESVPVFRTEYEREYMAPSILDTAKNDITSLFFIDNTYATR